MALRVQVSTPPSVSVKINPATKIAATVNKFDMSLVKLEDLLNVDEAVYGLNDGVTVVYNLTTQQWETKVVSGLGNIDGGMY